MNKTLRTLSLATVCALPTLALAHTGATQHDHGGLVAGFMHPFTGMDHLAAMVGVGVWSALSARRIGAGVLAAPLAFALMLLAGALLALAGVTLPAIEPMIALSLLAVGVMVMTRLQLPAAAAAAVVGVFAVFHGMAHGQELAGGQAAATLAGMLAATVMLHGAGIGLGWVLRHGHVWMPRAAGAGVAALGATLLVHLA